MNFLHKLHNIFYSLTRRFSVISYYSFRKIFLRTSFLFAVILLVNSCEKGCVEADEFDYESIVVKAHPEEDGIYGSCAGGGSGQRANWHRTHFKSNGDKFVIKITGLWSPWSGDFGPVNTKTVNGYNNCTICSKLEQRVFSEAGDTTLTENTNCICHDGQNPAPQTGRDGIPRNFALSTDHQLSCKEGEPDCFRIDCESNLSHQNDPDLCTCTKTQNYPDLGRYAKADDYGVFHFALEQYNKAYVRHIPDEQSTCLYDNGLGLYLGLFSNESLGAGTERVHHMFSMQRGCDIKFNSEGKCISEDGVDMSYAIFVSKGDRIPLSDDLNGNYREDSEVSNDVYHEVGEEVRFIIYDECYNDNYGEYNLKIYGGIADGIDKGLLEYMVSMVEDILLGKVGEDGKREGSVIQEMYEAIVKDYGFASMVQMALIFYVFFFAASFLLGTISMDQSGYYPSRKEVLTRVLKIGLVLFFVSPDSWQYYNTYIVQFFKGGMDDLVSMIMNTMDQYNDNPTSVINIAKMNRAIDASEATRFSFIDLMIKKMFSEAVAKKVFGLFFGTVPFFALIYIIVIYVLIFLFLALMVYAASIYLINLIKLVFVLSIGPIFICFSLFTKTNTMFKNWVAFLGGRSLEIVFLFAILYNFLQILDRIFNEMLGYRTCLEGITIISTTIGVLVSYVDRSLIDWFSLFITFGGMMFITYLVMEKIPEVTGKLIKIGGIESGKGSSGLGATMGGNNKRGGAAGLMEGLKNVTGFGLGKAKSGAGYIGEFATWASDKSGLSDLIPFRSPRGLIRDRIISSKIEDFERDFKKSGFKGKELDAKVRKATFDHFAKEDLDGPSFSGITQKAIMDMLNERAKDRAKDLVWDKYFDTDKFIGGKGNQYHNKSEMMKLAEREMRENSNLSDDEIKRALKDMFSPDGANRRIGDIISSKLIDLFADDRKSAILKKDAALLDVDSIKDKDILSKIKGAKGRIAEIEGDIDSKEKQLKHLDELAKKGGVLESERIELESELKELKDHKKNLEDALKEMQERQDSMQEDLDNIPGRIAQIEQDIHNVEKEMNDKKDELLDVYEVQAKADELREEIGSQQQELDGLAEVQAKADELKEEIAAKEETLDNIADPDVRAAIEEEIRTMQDELHDIDESGVQARMEEVEESIAVKQQELENIGEEAAKEKEAELKEEIDQLADKAIELKEEIEELKAQEKDLEEILSEHVPEATQDTDKDGDGLVIEPQIQDEVAEILEDNSDSDLNSMAGDDIDADSEIQIEIPEDVDSMDGDSGNAVEVEEIDLGIESQSDDFDVAEDAVSPIAEETDPEPVVSEEPAEMVEQDIATEESTEAVQQAAEDDADSMAGDIASSDSMDDTDSLDSEDDDTDDGDDEKSQLEKYKEEQERIRAENARLTKAISSMNDHKSYLQNKIANLKQRLSLNPTDPQLIAELGALENEVKGVEGQIAEYETQKT